MLHEGEFDSGSVESPITAVGNQELRTRGGEGGDFNIVGLVGPAPVNGHAAFAIAAPEEVGGDLADRNGDRYPFVHGRENKGLGSSSGASGHSYAGRIDAREGEEEVKRAHAVPCLHAQNLGSTAMVPANFFRVPIAHHVILEDRGTHPGEGRTADLP